MQDKNNTTKNTNNTQNPSSSPTDNKNTKSVYGMKNKMNKFGGKKRGFKKEKSEFDQRILDIARVTRVMGGGKRLSFRVCVGVGNKKQKIGIGMGKGKDVAIAVEKAVNRANKTMIDIPTVNGTIPHEIFHKFSAAKILFKPAAKGKGVIAGGVVRVILELAGINNITCKILGTSNKVSNAKCTIEALKSFVTKEVKKEVEDNKKENKDSKDNIKNKEEVKDKIK